MGRRADPQHVQWVIDEWRGRLVAAGLVRGGRVTARDLIIALHLDPPATRAGRNTLDRAAHELSHIAAAASPTNPGHAGDLDRWITRYLVEPGDALLISETLRRQALARARNLSRRRRQIEASFRSATVIMSAAAWSRLEALREELPAPAGEWTLGALIEQVLQAYDARREKPAGHPKRRPPSSAQPDTGDLFGRREDR